MHAQGLSPRLRGNAVFITSRVIRCGSIPALAGERGVEYRAVFESGVYPRACGGTAGRGRHGVNNRGLSPRLRGNVLPGSRSRLGLGSIPALAGERQDAAD